MAIDARVRVAMGIVEAVSAMHRLCAGLSVALNDIKPDNILMMGDKPVLIDFGSARWRLHDNAVTASGGPGMVAAEAVSPRSAAELLAMWSDDSDDSDDLASLLGGGHADEGTYLYMGPERVMDGRHMATDGRRGDVFSVGLLLWQLLSSQCQAALPYTQSSRSRMTELYRASLRHGFLSLYDQPGYLAPLMTVPQVAVRAIVAASLHFDPQARPTMEQMQSVFSTALAVQTILVTTVATSSRQHRQTQVDHHLTLPAEVTQHLLEAGMLCRVEGRKLWLAVMERVPDGGWRSEPGVLTERVALRSKRGTAAAAVGPVSDGHGLVEYVRACVTAVTGNAGDADRMVDDVMAAVSVVVVPSQPKAVEAFFENALEQCATYINARERPGLPDGTVFTTANAVLYQRWRELEYQVHTQVRRQSPEERDLRVALYDAWLARAGGAGAVSLVDQVRVAGAMTAVQGQGDVRLMMVYHGTSSLEVALKIVKGGMKMLNTTDQGWYGQGYYFTPDLATAKCYSRQDDSAKGLRYVVVCAVLCGNVYPVVEHPVDGSSVVMGDAEAAGDHPTLTGRGLVSGFDTHIAWVDMVNPDPRHGTVAAPVMASRAPVGGRRPARGVAMEVVARENSQILPVAILGLE